MDYPEICPAAQDKSPHVHWGVVLISYLVVAIKARDKRIARLEELDRQKAVALDEMRRRAERRAA